MCHGVDVHVQNEPNNAREVRRNSQGTRVRQDNGSNWFHFAIPTATQLVDRSVEIWNAYLKADMNGNATIVAVHTYMGQTRIDRRDGLTLSNRHPLDQTFDVTNRTLTDPLVMCVKVDFEEGGEIVFIGAGAQIVGPEIGG
jgi:hypothetical protein